jgi:hypothetical protein
MHKPCWAAILPSWAVSVANATAGFCLAAVGLGSANTAAGWQFVLGGALMLAASGLQFANTTTSDLNGSHRWGLVLLLLEGVVGVASLGVAAATFFLAGDRHGVLKGRKFQASLTQAILQLLGDV